MAELCIPALKGVAPECAPSPPAVVYTYPMVAGPKKCKVPPVMEMTPGYLDAYLPFIDDAIAGLIKNGVCTKAEMKKKSKCPNELLLRDGCCAPACANELKTMWSKKCKMGLLKAMCRAPGADVFFDVGAKIHTRCTGESYTCSEGKVAKA
jgi:hypothetical protein